MAKPKASFSEGGKARSFDFSPGETVVSALLRLGYHPDSLIVLHEGEPVAESEALVAGREYKLVLVASGG